jgi:hypothetical protein
MNLDETNQNKSREIGHIKFTGNVEKIYDAAVSTHYRYPVIIEPQHPRLRSYFCHPALGPLESENKQ